MFAYSDVTHAHVMHCASRALASGCDVSLLGPAATMLASSRPVIAISAVRTGCGKSQVARWLSSWLRERGWRVAVLRHPMPYGDLVAARAQRFATMADLDAAGCTAEEREEYEPHLAAGNLVFAGVDYAEVLRQAEREADLIVWDGGNNDFPFVRPGLHLVLADALRPDQVDTHHPGETVARMADALIVNKVDAVEAPAIEALEQRLRAVNAHAPIVRAASPVRLDDPRAVAGQRVLVVEDGPTITHGGMASGAGYVAALAAGAAAIVDPRPFADGSLAATYAAFPHIGPVLPAMGYGPAQRAELARCIAASGAEAVVVGTPFDLASMLGLSLPVVARAIASSSAAARGSTRSSATGSEPVNESGAPERLARTAPIEAQSAAVARATASICNEEWRRSGRTSGRGGFFHRLSRLAISKSMTRVLPRSRPSGVSMCCSTSRNTPSRSKYITVAPAFTGIPR
ncbi:MAG: hypothetical protein M5U30_07035 [Burkholderiaceae bacterium]|nr:hypothetical protein [Burkholderiaceae bacterium]